MYFRTATRTKGDKVYQSLHLVESYRTGSGKVRQRILINFGSAHRYTKEEVREIIGTLSKFFGLEEAEPEGLFFDCSLDFGGTYAISRIWEELGWSEIFTRALRAHRHDFDVIANLKVLVANRLLDPMAKLHILDWMEGVHVPGIEREAIDYNHLLRAMDFLIEHKGELEPKLASPLLTLFDTPLDLVFYDLTSCYFEIDQEDRRRKESRSSGVSTLRNYGHDRDRSGCPQVVLGLVMTREGLPLCHYVFPGETPDKVTLEEVITDLKKRFPIRRCVVVADRGLLTEENLEVLSEAELDYIVARPLRRNKVTREVIEAARPKVRESLRAWMKERRAVAKRECFVEVVMKGRRFVVAHSEEIARQSKRTRTAALSRATSYVTLRVARTIGQHNGTIPVTGKALSHQETLVHLHDYLKERNLTRYYRIWLDEKGTICWEPNEKARQWEKEIDGKLVLETTNRTMDPEEAVRQYKELQDVERCFRTLKSSLDIRPMHHWVDRRIEAHIFICVLALQIQRVMRQRLRKLNIRRSPEKVLEKLSRQRTVETDANGKTLHGLVRATEEQLHLFKALSMPAPQHKHLVDPTL